MGQVSHNFSDNFLLRGKFLEGESFVRKGEAGGWREYFTQVTISPLGIFHNFSSWLETSVSQPPFFLSGNGNNFRFLADTAGL